MLKILQSTTVVSRLGILLLALAIILPCRAAKTPILATLYNFTDLADGSFPEAGLVLGNGGSLFGTTSSGGSGWGSVFELTPTKGGTWTETTLYNFTGGADGGNPISDLVIGKNNVLYGTTNVGGAHGYGTVFEVVPSAGGVWTEKVLHSFADGSDGAYPEAGVALVSSGALYGTTYGGGSAGLGTVFVVTPSQSGWTEKVLYSFQGGVDGANPLADLVFGSGGVLFGTTLQGGSVTNSNGTFSNWGTVFALTPVGGGTWTESVIYTFTGGSDGGSPESPVIIGPSGVLYGNTFWGGTPTICPEGGYPQGCGTVYQLAPPTGGGTTWTQTVLHTFTGHTPDGAHPYRNMILNAGGTLFGTTFSGGANDDICFPGSYTGCGTIFVLQPPKTQGGTWTKSNLTVFSGTPSGGSPNGLILATKGGSLYGTTVLGGNAGGYGTVFEIAQ
jgi:uncharacterized repeat protein (TIGR03803 family)